MTDFKPGDIVMCIPRSQFPPGARMGAGYEEGRIFTIYNITNEIAWPTNYGSGVFIETIKHISWRARFEGHSE